MLPGDMSVHQLADILGDPSRKDQYQFLDVREPDELKLADIKGAGFVNLPISQFQTWYGAGTGRASVIRPRG
jgi:rhodanese-related sulfurtransferase